MVIPTPKKTLQFSTRMLAAQVAILFPPFAGFTATASSKFVIVMFLITKLVPDGSIPSVFKGKVGIFKA